MIWLIPLLLVCLFLLFRFVSPYTPSPVWGDSIWGQSGPVEPFQPSPTSSASPSTPPLVSDEFRNAYEQFLGFYLPFQQRWRDALVRAWGLEQPVPSEGQKRKEPTDKDLAATVATLIQSQGKPFPSPPSGSSESLPAPATLRTLLDLDTGRIRERIPASADPYRNAVEWMNEQMLRAEKELGNALQGGSLPALEGFAGEGTCAELSQCFRENPELVRQLLLAQQEEAGSRLERTEREVMSRFAQFQQPKLVSAFELNGRLAKKAKETEAKAMSGDWIKDVRMGSGEKKVGLTPPPGGDALEELRRKDPERYKALEKKNASMFSVKQLIEQINQGLR